MVGSVGKTCAVATGLIESVSLQSPTNVELVNPLPPTSNTAKPVNVIGEVTSNWNPRIKVVLKVESNSPGPLFVLDQKRQLCLRRLSEKGAEADN